MLGSVSGGDQVLAYVNGMAVPSTVQGLGVYGMVLMVPGSVAKVRDRSRGDVVACT